MSIQRRSRRIWRTALITGAGGGIGSAFARALPAETDLILVGRSPDRLDALKEELAEPGRLVEPVVADLAEKEGRERVIAAGEDRRIDLLINNAGLWSFGPFLEGEAERERQIVEVNALAPLILVRALLPGMIARAEDLGGRAGLINLASTAAFVPVPGLAAYAASKAFVLSFTEALAAELGRRPVDVLALCPGATRSSVDARTGFSPGSLPGAVEPLSVACQALEALGRCTVSFTDLPSTLLLSQITAFRALIGRSLGLGTSMLRGFRRSA